MVKNRRTRVELAVLEIKAIEMYIANPKLTAKDIAKILGLDHNTVAKYIRYYRK